MKTSLAIVLATAALMFGAISAWHQSARLRIWRLLGKTPGRCGVAPCQTNSRRQAVGDCNEEPDSPPLV